ncbi:uncharacterized protein TRIADDRAFT_30263, partial [Trichoplax adhaerens]
VKASSNRQDCQTFVLHGENHTLGNAVRYLIMKNPETKLCGYSVPHPSQHKINLRIETNNEKDAIEVFRTGLQDLDQVCDHVLKTFDVSIPFG